MTRTVLPEASRRASPPSLYAPDGGRKYVTQAERARLLLAADSFETNKALFIQLLALSGARVSELLALTPASFQVESSTVAIVTLKRRRFCVREVPLPGQLCDALDRHFDLLNKQTDLTLCAQRLWPWRRESAWRMVKAAMTQAGVVGRAASPKGLRHGFGVGTLQAGAPLNLVQRWLGHARMATTAIYVDVTGPEERAFAALFWKSTGLGVQ